MASRRRKKVKKRVQIRKKKPRKRYRKRGRRTKRRYFKKKAIQVLRHSPAFF